MTPEGHNDLYPLLQQYLQTSDKPMTCHDLFEIPEVRAVAPSANRVSDYLGVMFRRGLLSRTQADGQGEHGRARWAYIWRERVTPEWKKQTRTEPVDYRPKPLLDRPNLHVSEDGTHLLLEMPELSIQIQLTPRRK